MSTSQITRTLSATVTFLVMAAGSLSATPRLGTVAIDHHVERDLIEASSSTDAVELEATSRGVTFHPDPERSAQLRLISLFYPERRLFWWTYEWVGPDGRPNHLADFAHRFTLTVTEEAIMGMELLRNSLSMWWLQSAETAASLQEGERRALDTIVAAFHSERSLPVVRLDEVKFLNHLTADFARAPGHALAPFEARILSATPSEEGWSITLAGRSGRRALVLLDTELGVASAREYRP